MIIDGLIGILGGAFLLGTLGSEKISKTADMIRDQQRKEIEQQYKDMFAAPREMRSKVGALIQDRDCREELIVEVEEDLKFIFGKGVDFRDSSFIAPWGDVYGDDLRSSTTNAYRIKNLLLAHQGKVDWDCYMTHEGFEAGSESDTRIGMRTIYLVEQYLRKFHPEEGKLYFAPGFETHGTGFAWEWYCIGKMKFKPFVRLPEMANDPRARLWESEEDLKKFDNYCERI